jgi:hypothetical protein
MNPINQIPNSVLSAGWTLEFEKEKQNRLESVEGKLNTMQSMMEKLALAITRTAD